MDTQIYLRKGFAELIILLGLLKVITVRQHKISHATLMLHSGGFSTFTIPTHWIPIPVTSLHQEFLEIVPYRNRDV